MPPSDVMPGGRGHARALRPHVRRQTNQRRLVGVDQEGFPANLRATGTPLGVCPTVQTGSDAVVDGR